MKVRDLLPAMIKAGGESEVFVEDQFADHEVVTSVRTAWLHSSYGEAGILATPDHDIELCGTYDAAQEKIVIDECKSRPVLVITVERF